MKQHIFVLLVLLAILLPTQAQAQTTQPNTLQVCDILLNRYHDLNPHYYLGFYEQKGKVWRCVIIADYKGEAYITAVVYLDPTDAQDLIRRIIVEHVGLNRWRIEKERESQWLNL